MRRAPALLAASSVTSRMPCVIESSCMVMVAVRGWAGFRVRTSSVLDDHPTRSQIAQLLYYNLHQFVKLWRNIASSHH